ncbi:hypothetical protein VP1G_10923 [Cytospora mali]|uniref:Uncharacterized protein n=1 Tax=Cytospora mali TaxID=578113 RepID=A0A194UZM3_CYTMA|nr:hypothetical protein VP1G_10923 [Valsa mali var. pyri (nom. inval.)]
MFDPDYWLTAVRAESWEGVRRRGLGLWQRWWTEKSHRPAELEREQGKHTEDVDQDRMNVGDEGAWLGL